MFSIFGLFKSGSAQTWESILDRIHTEFPEVRHVSTDTLAIWMASEGDRPLLIDVRNPEEYRVSHLKDAVLGSDPESTLRILENTPGDRRIVLYCSVGYRSSAMAQRLMKEGVTRVYNLEGSIFAWANEGRPVYRDDKPVEGVHPYDREWGKLLKKSLWMWRRP